MLAWTTKDATAAAGATALDVDRLRRCPATLAHLRKGATWLAVLVGAVLLVPVGISLLLAGTPLGGRALQRLLLGCGRRRLGNDALLARLGRRLPLWLGSDGFLVLAGGGSSRRYR